MGIKEGGMRIYIPVMGFGKAGGFRVLSKMANELVDRGHEVKFVCPSKSLRPYFPTKAEIIWSFSPLSEVPVLKTLLSFFFLWIKLISLKGGVVIASEHLVAYLLRVLPSRKFIKIYYIQAYEVNLVNGSFFKFIARCSYRLGLLHVVNSAQILPANINNYVDVIPAGIDLSLFRPKVDINCFKNDKNQIKIGCVGRSERWKGTKEIVEAFHLVFNHSARNIYLNIAVFKPEIPFELEGRVNFFPINSDEDLARFYEANDIVVATGLIEDRAFHYPCAEGMATGKIVISNYSPLVEAGSSFVIEQVNTEKIANALNSVLNISEETAEAEIHRNLNAVDRYSWRFIGDSFDKLIVRLCLNKANGFHD